MYGQRDRCMVRGIDVWSEGYMERESVCIESLVSGAEN
jgi:hypothetical protein